MLKPLFEMNLGGFPIYQSMLIIGLFAAMLVLNHQLKRAGVSHVIKSRVKKSFFFSTLFGVASANVINWFIHPELMDASIYDRITRGGFSFLFGLLGFLLFSSLFLRLSKVSVKYFLGLAVPSLLIAQFFARVGCSLTGCCYGKEITLFDTPMLFPARELEALFALVLFFVLSRCAVGKRLPIYLFCYSIFRFVADFWRDGDLGILFGVEVLTPSQILCPFIAVICGVMLFARPILRLFRAEHLLDRAQNKWLTIKTRIGIKQYQPLPNNFIGVTKMPRALKVIVWMLVISLGVFTVFTFVNPLQMPTFDSIRYKIEDGMSFLFHERSRETEIGETTGLSLTDVSSYGAVTDGEAAMSVVMGVDTWLDLDFSLRETQTLNNGNTLYIFDQTVDGKAVLGKTRALVTDDDGNALYVAGDSAVFTHSDRVLTSIPTQTPTIEEVFGTMAHTKEEMPCLYETEYGLLDAKHVILANDDGVPVLGVVVQAKDNRIVCLTAPKLGVISDTERNTIDFAMAAWKGARTDTSAPNAEDEVDRLFQALLTASEVVDLTEEEFTAVLDASMAVASATPNVSPMLFFEIVARETERMLLNRGASPTQAAENANRVRSAITRNGWKTTDDETALGIVVQPRKRSFRHKINYRTDTDVFRLTAEGSKGITMTLDADACLTAQIYNDEGLLLATVYAEDADTVKLYPEDGASFTVRVSDTTIAGDGSDTYDYSVTVGSFEVEEEVGRSLEYILRRIKDSYDKSNLALFASICAYEGEILSYEEMIAVGVLPTVVQSCADISCGSCNCGDAVGTNGVNDIAKAAIAEILVPQIDQFTDFSNLKDSKLSLRVIDQIETDRGTAAKVQLQITADSIVIYNGPTYFYVEELEKDTDETSEDTPWRIGGTFASGKRDYITDINTDELYALFGDTADSVGGESDLLSLYELCGEKLVAENSLALRYVDTDKAKQLHYSAEKILDFERYIARQNVHCVEIAIRRAEASADFYESLALGTATGKEVYDAITSPGKYLIKNIAEQNETTKFLWLVYRMMTNMRGVVTSIAIEGVVETAEGLAEQSKMLAELYQRELVIQKQELAHLEAVGT